MVFKLGDEMVSFEECVDCLLEGQNDIYCLCCVKEVDEQLKAQNKNSFYFVEWIPQLMTRRSTRTRQCESFGLVKT